MKKTPTDGAETVDPLVQKDREIAELKGMLEDLARSKNNEIEQLKNRYANNERALSDLEKAKRELEKSLEKEISAYKAKLQMTDRGLVITFLSEILFDPGKDAIKENGKLTLEEVGQVLRKDVLSSIVAVEGHTDNQPIKRSGWKSNWELSTARALSVVHFMIDDCGVSPERLSAVGYGEYHPSDSNATPAGQAKNRRVEILILPSNIKKVGK
ncbi:MAG: OmpA family protein [Candidatus Omnitrophica bacterium]|nr:OmpA family protein [Candidatus Omnitrophota bacterium]